ncbi:MAG: PAS domain-containing protein [Actinomycetota bacterium]
MLPSHDPDAGRTASSARAGALFHAYPDGVLALDADGRVIAANPAAAEVLARDEAALGGRHLAKVLPATAGLCLRQELDRALAGQDRRFVCDLAEGSRSQRAYEVTLAPVADSEAALLAVVRDVTHAARERRALEQREAHYRELCDVVGVGIVVTAADGTPISANPAFCALLGHDEADVRAGSLLALTHPDDRAAVAARYEQLRREELASVTFEQRYLHRDGSTVAARVSVSRVRDADGAATATVTVVEDASEVKAAHAAAEAVAARLTTTLESMTDAFYVLDGAWRFTYLNARGEQLLRRDRASLLGRTVWEAFPETVDSPLHRAYQRAMAERVTVVLEAYHHEPTDTWFEVNAYPSEEGLAVYFRDITARRRMQEQLRQAQRLESIGTLAGGMAHDLNNVLAPIVAAIGPLREGEQDPRRLELLKTVEDSALRGADMVQQVLSFARGSERGTESVDVAALFEEIVGIVRETFPRGIRCTTVVEPAARHLEADATQLHQVLLNLAVNARDAMPDGGHLRLSARRVIVPGDAAAAGDYVRLDVADEGTGIAEGDLAHLYDPFFTTKPPGLGTGLGLPTAEVLVRNHGGFIDVDTAPGRGTTFQVHLPAPRLTPSAPREPAPSRPPLGHGEVALVVEDEAAIRDLTRQMLIASGYGVLEAADGEEAIEVLARHGEDVDVAVVDAVMPRRDGPSLIAWLRSRGSTLPVVLASGRLGQPDDGLEADAHLPKPYTAAMLLEALDAVLRRAR